MSAKRANPSEPGEKALGLDAFRQPPEETGLSLNQLSQVFAGLLHSGDDPYTPPAIEHEPDREQAVDTQRDVDDACELGPRTILEAMLFVGHPQNQPLASKEVAALMRGVRPAEIDALVRELNRDYEARGCPYTIVADGAGYRMTLRDEFARMRDRFYGKARQARLSQASIEVLAAVAYNQPITAEEVNRLRGTACGHVLLQLVRRQLLCLERAAGQARKAQYRTTPRFLELFGLASLAELPRSADLEESS
ncbi:MAG: SMC-Scp complex subunit ScpB [Pirellulales bacterium]